MRIVKTTLLVLMTLLLVLYVAVCIWFYIGQEQALFKTVKIPVAHKYNFMQKFEERTIKMQDGVNLHGLLFKTESSKGLILWLPGGRGMLDSIGNDAKYYTDLGYDIFMLNYRGFGKSGGKIATEAQFNEDMQSVYDFLKREYSEQEIIIYGYSLGSGPAAVLASKNSPRMLILQAPYYSMTEMVSTTIPYLPVSLLLKYKFPTYDALKNVKSPVVIFHGDEDKKIDAAVSNRLKESLKDVDQVIILRGQGHNDFVKNSVYLSELKRVLNSVHHIG